jgi:hypothetical protein
MRVTVNNEEVTNPVAKVVVGFGIALFIGVIFSVIGAIFTSPVWLTYLVLR